jgi:hypothetical protein
MPPPSSPLHGCCYCCFCCPPCAAAAHQDVVNAAPCCLELLLECVHEQVGELLMACIHQGCVGLTIYQVGIVGGALLKTAKKIRWQA